MKRNYLLWVIVFVLILSVLLPVVEILLMNTPPGKRWVSHFASDMLGREVVLEGGIALKPTWPPTLRVSQLKIANEAGRKPETMLDLGEMEVQPSLLPLFIGHLDLQQVRLKDTHLVLQKDRKGRANWVFGEQVPLEEQEEEHASLPEIHALLLERSSVIYQDIPQKIDVSLEGHTQDAMIEVTGKGTYKGSAFSLNGRGASLLALVKKENYPLHVKAKVGNTSILMDGTLEDPLAFKAMNITLQVKGQSASEIFPLVGIALPPTPPYDIKGKLSHLNRKWFFRNFSGRMGDSDLSGNMTWDTAPLRPLLQAVLVSKNLDFDDLGGMIGVAPSIAPGETASATQVKQSLAAKASPFVIPDVPLDIDRLKAMDARVEFTGKKVISPGLPLDDFYMKLILDNSLLKTEPLRFGTANGDIIANVTINARQSPPRNTLEVVFRRLSLKRLMEAVGKKIGSKEIAEGYIGGKASLKGTGKSLREMMVDAEGNVGIGMEGGHLSNLLIELMGLDVAESLGFILSGDKPVPVRCIIGDFAVQAGKMFSRNFVIDTKDTVLTGKGEINLQSERMNLRLDPAPKDKSFLSLRSPIRVTGTLKSPKVGIEVEELAARGGIAAGLSVLLTPIVAVLAFVEPGLGKDSDCVGMLRQMAVHMKDPSGRTIPKNN